MVIPLSCCQRIVAVVSVWFAASVSHAAPTLNETCTINILNRTTQVQPDGSWILPNIPSNMGRIRARINCLQGGQTVSGQSDWFSMGPAGVVDVGNFSFQTVDPAPNRLLIDPPGNSTLAPGESLALQVSAEYRSQDSRNITSSGGINYSSSNADIAEVDANGNVTADTSGRALITERQDGVVVIKAITVTGEGEEDGTPLPHLHGKKLKTIRHDQRGAPALDLVVQ